MGRTYLFECAKCGYRAKISGGPDRGFHFAVQTILCLECRELHDAVTALKVAVPRMIGGGGMLKAARSAAFGAFKVPTVPPPFSTALNRLPPRSGRKSRWIQFKAACPVSPRHRVREWNRPDKCPKCGVYLEQNALPFRVWD